MSLDMALLLALFIVGGGIIIYLGAMLLCDLLVWLVKVIRGRGERVK